jgi:predicted protein tyrosine phosphatase
MPMLTKHGLSCLLMAPGSASLTFFTHHLPTKNNSMAIRTSLAVPYYVMKNYLSGDPTNRIAALAERHDRVWIISITSPYCSTSTNQCPPLVQDGEDRIALQFDDVDLDPPDPDLCDPDAVFFNREMAQKVVDFLRVANQGDTSDLLVVNCHMGVSRSGAVANFARSVFNIDFSDWRRLNPQVIPNVLVSSLLFNAWENSING